MASNSGSASNARACRASMSGWISCRPAKPCDRAALAAPAMAMSTGSARSPGAVLPSGAVGAIAGRNGRRFSPMPMTATRWPTSGIDSIRMPPSLRGRPPVPLINRRSFGHFTPMRGGCGKGVGCAELGQSGDGDACGEAVASSASASATPTASDSPDQSARCSGSDSEKVSEAPASASQLRPWRPRPWVCAKAISNAGVAIP